MLELVTMSSGDFIFCPGKPAAWLCIIDWEVDLVGLTQSLVASQDYLVFLDSASKNQKTGRFSILGWDPWLVWPGENKEVEGSNPLDSLRNILSVYPGPVHMSLPSAGVGFFGIFGYELSRWVEKLPSPKPSDELVPEMVILGMRMVLVVDHKENKSFCLSLVDSEEDSRSSSRKAIEKLKILVSQLDSFGDKPYRGIVTNTAGDVSKAIIPTVSQKQFEEMVCKAKEYIEAGEIFQANISQRFQIKWKSPAWELYLALRGINPSPFACFLRLKSLQLVSCSPERLVMVNDGACFARPIAGTRPRGQNLKEELSNSLELITNDKERAEHIMLVDLARNDMGRFCRYGSVKVDELMSLESYSHVVHIVSNICGRLKKDMDAVDVLNSMFPGGTITGCPKVRCMQIIHELEPVPRGFYTGSVGYIGFGGSLDLNILIRTIIAFEGHLSFHVGAGIVADSVPDREYHETLAKAEALIGALQISAKEVAVGCRL